MYRADRFPLGPPRDAAWRVTARLACLLLAATLTGCAAEGAGQRIQHIGRVTDGSLLLVRSEDFPDGDPQHGKATTLGSAALRDAVIADDGVASFVHAHGLPDAIGVAGLGFTLHLAYLRDDKLYTLEHSSAEWVSPRAWTPSAVTGERALTDAELAVVDPDRRGEKLRALFVQYDRLQAVGRRMMEAGPPLGGKLDDYGVVFVGANAAAARAFGGEADEGEKIVAWVDPAGPQRDVLRVGDRITAVNGVSLAVAERTGTRWEGQQRLTIRRDGVASDVDLAPQSWSQRVRLVLMPEEIPNAFTPEGGQAIVVTSGLAEIFPEDDALAMVVGHELAHIALGHAEPPSAASKLATGVLGFGMLPVLIPANLVRPGTAQDVVGAMRKGFNRDEEREADRLGMQLTRQAGYDPRAALVVVDRMQERAPVGGIDQFFDIHPPYPERRALIEASLVQQERQ